MTDKHTLRTAYSEGYEDGWYRSTRIGGRSSDPFWETKDWFASRTSGAPEMATEIQRLRAERDTLLEKNEKIQRLWDKNMNLLAEIWRMAYEQRTAEAQRDTLLEAAKEAYQAEQERIEDTPTGPGAHFTIFDRLRAAIANVED